MIWCHVGLRRSWVTYGPVREVGEQVGLRRLGDSWAYRCLATGGPREVWGKVNFKRLVEWLAW